MGQFVLKEFVFGDNIPKLVEIYDVSDTTISLKWTRILVAAITTVIDFI